MAIEEEAPKGICHKCRMVRIKRGGIAICPNCDTLSEPSGLVNTLEDPGHLAMEKIMSASTPKDLPEASEKDIVEYDKKGYPEITISTFDKLFNDVSRLPMPSDMKSIKKLLKVKQLLLELSKGE